ncbi:NAD(P)-dependent oxidoreductase [Gordonia jacobaea]|uniref:NAD(P)-dependent oxidoreductase n=1 Tax=Gordonia jacobaea TaxID=122202 RepID=UPI003D71ACE3
MTQNEAAHRSAGVTMIGLGPMGSALAQAFLTADVPTTVWNRTRSASERMAEAGATVADDLASAVSSARLVITCLRDHEATREVLGSLPGEVFGGRVVVVLASSTPHEARTTQRWADERGIDVLIGAILVPTPVIGTPEALILYSGRRDLLERHRSELEVVAPRSTFVGDDPATASILDTGMLEIFFSGMTAFLHAAALVTSAGHTASSFVPMAIEMLDILPATFLGLAADVDAGEYPGTEENIAMEAAALRHIVDSSVEAGLDARLPRLMHDLATRAVEEGYGADGWSRVVELLRTDPAAPA